MKTKNLYNSRLFKLLFEAKQLAMKQGRMQTFHAIDAAIAKLGWEWAAEIDPRQYDVQKIYEESIEKTR